MSNISLKDNNDNEEYEEIENIISQIHDSRHSQENSEPLLEVRNLLNPMNSRKKLFVKSEEIKKYSENNLKSNIKEVKNFKDSISLSEEKRPKQIFINFEKYYSKEQYTQKLNEIKNKIIYDIINDC